MATGEQTTPNELSLDLSLLYDQDDVCTSGDALRDLSTSSSEQDGMEELVIPDDTHSKRSESTRLDLSGLSGSSTASSGPSLSRDRTSALPSVHQRPFLASEAWGGSDTDSEGRSRRTMRGQDRGAGVFSRADSVDRGMASIRIRDRLLNAETLNSVTSGTSSSKTSPPRPPVHKSVAFGTSVMRDHSYQSSRLYGDTQGQPRVLPPFLRAHTRERRLQSLQPKHENVQKQTEKEKSDMDKIQMPKDFATLHLMARRSQGHLRYRYMAMLNQWISEHGLPT